jgi:hypothetical protein
MVWSEGELCSDMTTRVVRYGARVDGSNDSDELDKKVVDVVRSACHRKHVVVQVIHRMGQNTLPTFIRTL